MTNLLDELAALRDRIATAITSAAADGTTISDPAVAAQSVIDDLGLAYVGWMTVPPEDIDDGDFESWDLAAATEEGERPEWIDLYGHGRFVPWQLFAVRPPDGGR